MTVAIVVCVNGEARTVDGRASVADLVATLDPAMVQRPRGIAVAVNREIVPRAQWAGRLLQPDDRIDVVHAIGGG